MPGTLPLGKSTSVPSLTAADATQKPSLNIDVSKIPNLPGTQIQERLLKKHFPRQNTWSFVKGQRIERDPNYLVNARGKFVKAPKNVVNPRVGSLPMSTTHGIYSMSNLPTVDYDELPAWDVLDRHVLRFYAYGQSTVGETNLENYRVQKFTILFYLQDETIQIMAPRSDNNGLGVYAAVGGQADKGLSSNVLKRGKLMRADKSGFVSAEDLRVGSEFAFLGQKVLVYDCDAFTEEYYGSIGNPQDMSLKEAGPPGDAFSATIAKKKTVATKPERTNEKIYFESMLNGGHINVNMQDFMEKDRKVMRFFAVVDDTQTSQFERRPFIILYFLADGTMQIREQYPLNCGRDSFPLYCKKSRIPKGKVEVRGPMHSAYQPDEYISLDDLFVGQKIEIYNNVFHIYDADGFTRQYFTNELKKPLEDKLDVRLPEKEHPRPVTPPYTGLGSWDDSMSSVLHLIPKKPKKDLAKLFFNDGKCLRFSAKFSGSVAEEDLMRRFLITYYLYDDCLMIHEPPQRNLGIVTGRFLEKTVYLNQLTGKLFHPNDFMIGNEVKVLNHQFLVIDMDEYTRNYFKMIESGEDTHPANTNLNDVLRKLKESVGKQFPLMRDIFRRFDADRNGVLCYHEIERALQKFGFHLSPEETLCIMKHFDPEGTGQVDYNTFCETCFEADFGYDHWGKEELKINAEELAGYADIAAQKTIDRAETEKVRRAVRMIQDVYVNRSNMTVRLTAEFSHMTHTNFVNWEQVRTAFVKLGYVFEPEDVQRCIKFVMPETDLNAVNYALFLQKLRTTFHDMTASR